MAGWVCEAYSTDTAGGYTFTPTLGELPHPPAEGVPPPTLAVTLQKAPQGGQTGEPAPQGPTLLTGFAPLPEEVAAQGFDAGETDAQRITLPDTLQATGEGEATLVVTGVTWNCTAPATVFDGKVPGLYIFAPTLPWGHTPAEGATAPRITVVVREYGPL